MKVAQYFIVTAKYLKEHPNTIFVYSGNYSHYLPLYLTREVINQLHPFMVQVLPSTSLNRDGKFFTPRAYLKYIYPIEEQSFKAISSAILLLIILIPSFRNLLNVSGSLS